MAPAPASPQNKPAIIFPIPCPISSLLLLCLVFVILSAATEVKRVSIEPNPAKVIPGMIVAFKSIPQSIPVKYIPSLIKKGIGNPVGIFPIVSLSGKSTKREMIVITISATNVDGIFFVIKGKRYIIAMVPIPIPKAMREKPSETIFSGNCNTISITKIGDFKPIRGYICCNIMMIPIPVINPDSTGYGIYLTYFPIFSIPNII